MSLQRPSLVCVRGSKENCMLEKMKSSHNMKFVHRNNIVINIQTHTHTQLHDGYHMIVLYWKRKKVKKKSCAAAAGCFCTCSHLSVLLPYRIECCRSRVPRVKYTSYNEGAHVLIFPKKKSNYQQPPAHTFPTKNSAAKGTFFFTLWKWKIGCVKGKLTFIVCLFPICQRKYWNFVEIF